MINLTKTCTNQIIKAICPSPSKNQLRHILGLKLSTSPNMTLSQRKTKTINEQFDHLISTIFSVMNASKKDSNPKKIARAILCAGIPKPIPFGTYVKKIIHHTLAMEQLEWKL